MGIITTEYSDDLGETELFKSIAGRKILGISKGSASLPNYSGSFYTEDEVMTFTLEGGATLYLWDDGQSCCETRYMTCDDDLSSFVGRAIVGIEEVDLPDEPEGPYGECHEKTFVKVITDDGANIAITSHNEHNGYYGGFNMKLALETA